MATPCLMDMSDDEVDMLLEAVGGSEPRQDGAESGCSSFSSERESFSYVYDHVYIRYTCRGTDEWVDQETDE